MAMGWWSRTFSRKAACAAFQVSWSDSRSLGSFAWRRNRAPSAETSRSASSKSGVSSNKRDHHTVTPTSGGRFLSVTRTHAADDPPRSVGAPRSSSQSSTPAQSSTSVSLGASRKVGRSSPRHHTSCLSVARHAPSATTHRRVVVSNETSRSTSFAAVAVVANRTVSSSAVCDHANATAPVARSRPMPPSSVASTGVGRDRGRGDALSWPARSRFAAASRSANMSSS
mmetsp:Transcript_13590/g.54492  ORF Transcript_13590/g.54492 Transcript_13590/m.54492 type:complete len:227 (+) Transcript_13590:1552-2232(+)